MTAQVHIVLAHARGVRTISSAALTGAGPDGTFTVRVVGDDGRITPRQVKIGLNNKTTAEVLSGLEPGERVVTGRKSAEPQASRLPPGGPPPMMRF